MAKRNSKTAAQQCRYYEVDNIFVYMVETYINGNFETFRRLYHELNKDARRAVSYTHLDVYKRQSPVAELLSAGNRPENGAASSDTLSVGKNGMSH